MKRDPENATKQWGGEGEHDNSPSISCSHFFWLLGIARQEGFQCDSKLSGLNHTRHLRDENGWALGSEAKACDLNAENGSAKLSVNKETLRNVGPLSSRPCIEQSSREAVLL